MAMTIAERDSSGRALVPGLETAQPLASMLPSLLQEDDFCVRLTSAFDDVLAPVLVTLDCFGSYLDPRIAPQDFVNWLAGWVGVETDETWPADRRRRLVAEAIEVYQLRGTVKGLARHVELYAGTGPSIEESGGCAWSQDAGADFPGSPQPRLVVRLELDGPSHVDAAVVERIVRFSRPAHVPHEVFLTIKSELVQPEAEAHDQSDAEDSGDAPPAVLPPDASVAEVGPGVPAGREDDDEPVEGVTTELIDEKEAESESGSSEPAFDIFAETTPAETAEDAGDEFGAAAPAAPDEGLDAPRGSDAESGGPPEPIGPSESAFDTFGGETTGAESAEDAGDQFGAPAPSAPDQGLDAPRGTDAESDGPPGAIGPDGDEPGHAP